MFDLFNRSLIKSLEARIKALEDEIRNNTPIRLAFGPNMRFEKVVALPTPTEPDTFYMVADTKQKTFRIVMTGMDGTPYVHVFEHLPVSLKESYLALIEEISKESAISMTQQERNTMQKAALYKQYLNTLFNVCQGRGSLHIDAEQIQSYGMDVGDMFFAIERELSMRTQETTGLIAHAGYNVTISLIPIPNAAPLCVRCFKISKDGMDFSFGFSDSTPVRAETGN